MSVCDEVGVFPVRSLTTLAQPYIPTGPIRRTNPDLRSPVIVAMLARV